MLFYTVIMIPYRKDTKRLARENRRQRNATKQEGVLWHCYLKNCSVRFFRQYRVEGYILDFYAPSLKLAIEIDGGQHNQNPSDKIRDEYLTQHDVKILRFWNNEILGNIEGCRQAIQQEITSLSISKKQAISSPCSQGEVR